LRRKKVETNRLQQFQKLCKASRTAIVQGTAVLSFIASAAIITGCTPAIHSAASDLYMIQTGASQNTSADHLVIVTEPGNAAANSAIGPTIEVEFVNQAGQVDTSMNSVVSVAIGINPGGGTLTGSMSATAVNGIATFSGLSINKVGSGYTLTATSGTLSSAPSAGFNVTAGAAFRLVFTDEPINTAANASLGSVAVSVEDVAGNLVTTSSATISLTFGTNPSSGTLAGTTVMNASSGVATFSTLSINNGGTGYTLKATSGSLNSATSSPFNITFPTPTSFAWSGSATPASATCQAYTIQAQKSGAPAAYATATTVTLSGAGLGNFYGPGDTSCASGPVTTVSFGVGVSSVTIYYKDPNVGPVTLASTAGSATGNISIKSTGLYVLSAATSTPSAGAPTLMTIKLENSLGATINAPSAITFNLSGVFPGYYDKLCASTDPTCASSAITSVTIASGSSSGTFYYQDNRVETPTVAASDTSGYLNGSPNNVNLTVQPNNVASGSFVITGPTFVTPGTCATYTVTVVDQSQNISPLTSARTVALATSAGGQFFGPSDASCGTPLTSVPIASGASTVVFHFMDNTTPDNPTLSSTATGFTSVSFNAHAVTSIPTISLGGTDVTSCSIINGDLKCWGDNFGNGMIGNDTTGAVTLPTQVTGLTSGVTSVSGSTSIACATQNGGLECWTGDGFGDTGGAVGEGFVFPTAAPGFGAGSGITQIAIGAADVSSSCMILNGGVYCAGDNSVGQLGNGETMNAGGTYIPVPAFPQGSGVTTVYGGQDSYCTIIDGGADCWGQNFTTSPSYAIAQGTGVTNLVLEKFGAYAVIGGQIYSFDGSPPALYRGGSVTGVTKLSAGFENTCALASGGTVYCWAFGGAPTQVPGITGAIDIQAQQTSACALLPDSEVKCWGTNYGGNLGTGTITDSPTAVSIGSIY
jgi:hypothetical protein